MTTLLCLVASRVLVATAPQSNFRVPCDQVKHHILFAKFAV